MENVIGIWNSTWRKQGVESPLKGMGKCQRGRFSNSQEIVDYLNSGHKVISRRSILSSDLTQEIIGAPEILYDGTFIWSSEYSYYVKLGFIQVDQSLSAHAEKNDFLITPASEIDLEKLNGLLEKVGFPTVTRWT